MSSTSVLPGINPERAYGSPYTIFEDTTLSSPTGSHLKVVMGPIAPAASTLTTPACWFNTATLDLKFAVGGEWV